MVGWFGIPKISPNSPSKPRRPKLSSSSSSSSSHCSHCSGLYCCHVERLDYFANVAPDCQHRRISICVNSYCFLIRIVANLVLRMTKDSLIKWIPDFIIFSGLYHWPVLRSKMGIQCVCNRFQIFLSQSLAVKINNINIYRFKRQTKIAENISNNLKHNGLQIWNQRHPHMRKGSKVSRESFMKFFKRAGNAPSFGHFWASVSPNSLYNCTCPMTLECLRTMPNDKRNTLFSW